MLQFSLPTPEDTLFTTTVQMDGSSYTFEFDWNSRLDRWFLNILSSDGERILDNILLTAKYDLTRHIADNTPPGVLWLFSPSETDPTRLTIAECALFYLAADEIE